MTLAIGLDLGGTKIEVVALDPGGREIVRRRRLTPRDYEGTLEALVALVDEVERETGSTGTVGLCHPGAMSPATGLLKNANTVWLADRPFDIDVRRCFGRPVAMANDANCLALSEATDGAGAGARVVFAGIIGTGVGGGIVVDGRLLTGPNAIAGEWGHVPLGRETAAERPGPPCDCGLIGCIETWVSGPGFAADHHRRTGQSLPAPEIVARAAVDPACRESLDLYIDRLGRALATVVSIIDPDVIVLGGGMSNVAAIYPALPAAIERWAFTDRLATPVRRALHGDSSGVRGAAWLGRDLARTTQVAAT